MDDSKRIDEPTMVQPANHGDSDCTPGHMDTQSHRFGHVERRSVMSLLMLWVC
jgi:hypothetical protein